MGRSVERRAGRSRSLTQIVFGPTYLVAALIARHETGLLAKALWSAASLQAPASRAYSARLHGFWQSALRLSGSDAPAPQGSRIWGLLEASRPIRPRAHPSARGAFLTEPSPRGTGSKPKYFSGPWRRPARSPQSRFREAIACVRIGLYNLLRVQLRLCTLGGERAAAGLRTASHNPRDE